MTFPDKHTETMSSRDFVCAVYQYFITVAFRATGLIFINLNNLQARLLKWFVCLELWKSQLETRSFEVMDNDWVALSSV